MRHLLKRRMPDAWRVNQIDELLYEAERCNQRLSKPQQGKQDDGRVEKKHPEPRKLWRRSLPYDELPPLIDVDVTAAHVKKVY